MAAPVFLQGIAMDLPMPCPLCGGEIKLRWDGEGTTLEIAACESAGVYSVILLCPHCDARFNVPNT